MGQSPKRETAKCLLRHYLTLAGQGTDFEAGNNYTRYDYRAEMEGIVDAVVDAVVDAAKDELRAELTEIFKQIAEGGKKV